MRAGPCALQRNYYPGPGDSRLYKGSEDCLYLNIWAPSQSSLNPVMVWVHGGGNRLGDSAQFYGGLLAQSQSVVVVTFNYRLGVLGWFTHPALRHEEADAKDCSGNYGTLDMLAALRWVQENISAFGGDPDRVTLFGESSGASNIYSLLVSPLSKGLFHRAIIQSGSPTSTDTASAEMSVDTSPQASPLSSAELLLQLLMDKAEARTRSHAHHVTDTMPAHEVRRFLRSRTFEQLDKAIQGIIQSHSHLQSSPSLPNVFNDGVVLPREGVAEAIKAGHIDKDLAVIVGSTRDEMTLLPPFVRNTSFATLNREGGVSIANKERYYLAVGYLSRLFRAHGTDQPAHHLSRAGCPVYCYRFDWDRLAPLSWADDIELRATHGLDVPFVFGHMDMGPEYFHLAQIRDDVLGSFHQVSRHMRSYWAAFAEAGSPDKGQEGELLEWPSINRHGRVHDLPFMTFTADAKCPLKIRHGAESKQLILQALATDPYFSSPQERAEFLRGLVSVVQEFGLLNHEDCQGFPYYPYPNGD